MNNIFYYKIPIGLFSSNIFYWLKNHAEKLFSFIREYLNICLDYTFYFLTATPVFLPIFLLLSFIFSNKNFYRFIIFFFLLIITLIDNKIFYNQYYLTMVLLLINVFFLFFIKKNHLSIKIKLFYTISSISLLIIYRLFVTNFIPNYVILVTFLSLFSWLTKRKVSYLLLTIFGLLFVINQGYWEDTMETLSVLIWSCIFCLSFGTIFGILCAHHIKLYRILRPILDLMQTLPSFIYLIPALFFFRIGMVSGLIATFIFVLPTPIRLIQKGISSTPKYLIETAISFGADPWQLLLKIELPHAIPEIKESITQVIMLSLSMVVITATVGGNGLGVKVYRALQTGNIAMGFEAGCVIVVVAIILDRIFR